MRVDRENSLVTLIQDCSDCYLRPQPLPMTPALPHHQNSRPNPKPVRAPEFDLSYVSLCSFLFLPNFQQFLLFFLVEMAERLQRYVNVNHLAPGVDQPEGDRPWDFVTDS